ncbi:SDR family oxidoreductase [Planococcus ruber]|uniref:SDR family oxidoreductase n=1 Tax=Planococcus ruber TaxID=2027871 RepID=UPI001FED8169|nr:SDR family oxidoreductase [Planococcus ruber]MCJ1907067.1 SDR family oxidoreductase [Planococcus ruber]
MEEIVFTGFPGFIASQLIRTVLKKETSAAAIVLPTEMEKAKKEAIEIQRLTRCEPIRLMEGDITKEGLGLNDADAAFLKEKEVVFWHLAAIYDLAVPREIAWKVNVEGTKNVNRFVSELPRLKRYIYFSTAFVAGDREGTLYENELIRPKNFKNFYEETKFEAELLVEAMKEIYPVTIIRPGIVRGNSETGETIKFDGPYFFLNMIDRLRKLPIIPYIGRSTAFINVVPVDYILKASVYLSNHKEAEGKTVHLTDPSPHPVEEVYRKMVQEITGKTPKLRLPHAVAALSLKSVSLQRFLGVEAETLDYLTWNAHFDTATAKRLLEGSDIVCADFLETIPAMVRFYELHKFNKNFHVTIG